MPPENISLELHPNNTLSVSYVGTRPDRFTVEYCSLDGINRSSILSNNITAHLAPIEFGEGVWNYSLDLNLSREVLLQLDMHYSEFQ